MAITTSSPSSSSPSHTRPPTPSPPPRPKFAPTPLPLDGCELAQSDHTGWINVIEAPAYCPLIVFTRVLDELCHHPERNSSFILRADILQQSEPLSGTPSSPSASSSSSSATHTVSVPPHYTLIKSLRRKLLPRRPIIDGSLEQSCYFYETEVSAVEGAGKGKRKQGMVLMVPEVEKEEDIPYYHPKLQALAFHYTELPYRSVFDEDSNGEESQPSTPGQPPILGTISISILPFPQESETISSSPSTSDAATADKLLPNRTYRTCLHLLETVHKHSYGMMVGYQKRVIHDVVVEKTSFQDLYLIMKERHKHLDSRVLKGGGNKLLDVKRHVWKDVAVATFLMLLWRDMYPSIEKDGNGRAAEESWSTWGRPKGGFVDLGCGNGLLVHILTAEGYAGIGLELRSRKTWPSYPQSTQDVLIESAVDPTQWFPSTMEEWEAGDWVGRESCPLKEGAFLIGNHADEMTPWIPLLSLIPRTPIPFLSLPCCLHTLSSMFILQSFKPPPHHAAPPDGFGHGFQSGGESRYTAYLMWLGWQGLLAGWKWEKEGMRVPSTRGWGIVGRERWTTEEEDTECRRWALEQVKEVRANGFVVREGRESALMKSCIG